MKERGILFSAPMVRAVLDSRKAVTRRLVRESARGCIGLTGDGRPVYVTGAPDDGGDPIRCPYGVAGDRLWVRETWRHALNALAAEACGGAMGTSHAGPAFEYRATAEWPNHGSWKPAIHMPRSASRIVLEVTDVRAERLHDITEEDLFDEGIEPNQAGSYYVEKGDALVEFDEPRPAFAFLWDALNADRAPWSANPWVWRVAFRRLP